MSSDPYPNNLSLSNELNSSYFPYNRILCIEASLSSLTSNDLKILFFPDLIIALHVIIDTNVIDECVIIQKCNCVEIYTLINSNNINEVIALLKKKWEDLIHFNINSEIWDKIHIYYGKDVIFHLYRVVCSIESLIIGDNQVHSQVVSSFDIAKKQKTVGPVLSHIFKEAFSVAKKVYTQTELFKNGVSLGRVAVAILMTNFDVSPKVITIVGSGEISETVINGIHKKWKTTNIHAITQRPEYINDKYNNPMIRGRSRDDLIRYARESDAIILCTNLATPIIRKNDIIEIISYGKLKVLIDLGMPPNVEYVNNSTLSFYSLLDLVDYGKNRFLQRLDEKEKAMKIIEESYYSFEGTIIDYKKEKILKKIAPEIHRALKKPDIESSIMGIFIKIFNNLSLENLDAIEISIEKNNQK